MEKSLGVVLKVNIGESTTITRRYPDIIPMEIQINKTTSLFTRRTTTSLDVAIKARVIGV